jgi:hypothetical protein
MSYRQYLTGDILTKLDNDYTIVCTNEDINLSDKYAIYTNGNCNFNFTIEKILENDLIQVIQELRTNRKFKQRSILDTNNCILFCLKKKTKNRLLYYFKKKI